VVVSSVVVDVVVVGGRSEAQLVSEPRSEAMRPMSRSIFILSRAAATHSLKVYAPRGFNLGIGRCCGRRLADNDFGGDHLGSVLVIIDRHGRSRLDRF